IERVTIASEPRCVVLAANGEGDRPCRKIEQVAVNGCVINRQLIFTGVMQSNINSLPGPRAVLTEKAAEWIKRRGWVRVQQGIAQSWLAHFANGQVLSFVARVTET